MKLSYMLVSIFTLVTHLALKIKLHNSQHGLELTQQLNQTHRIKKKKYMLPSPAFHTLCFLPIYFLFFLPYKLGSPATLSMPKVLCFVYLLFMYVYTILDISQLQFMSDALLFPIVKVFPHARHYVNKKFSYQLFFFTTLFSQQLKKKLKKEN